MALPVLLFWSQVVVRIRPSCWVDEEEAGEDGRGPEACVRKTAAISVAVQGQDSTFDAVADSVSTQVRLGDFFVWFWGSLTGGLVHAVESYRL